MVLHFPQEIISHRTKGIPGGTAPFPLADIAGKNWNALSGNMPSPIAIIREPVLARNADWMKQFCALHAVSLAPHGKTTMSPKIFDRQLESGAWAITLSTAHQVQAARDFGVPRILIANQVVDPAFLDFLTAELDRDDQFDLLLLVDSRAGLQFLLDRFAKKPWRRPLGVLIEIGASGGRTGMRQVGDAVALAQEIAGYPEVLALRGIEGFEGIYAGTGKDILAKVDALLANVVAAAQKVDRDGLFSGEIVLSAGGSSFFDRVLAAFSPVTLSLPVRIVLRSGCYVAHDARMYADYFAALGARVPTGYLPPGHLEPALSVLARVQSMPEPGQALLTAGKRDLSFDVHMPQATHYWREGMKRQPAPLGDGYEIYALADQHSFLRVPADTPLRVGDVVMLGISHPCTTFDKWDVLYGVDDDFTIRDAYKTYF
ncbi:MAG: hypothetical protein ABS76_33690 [Pelagibacterium sp. SCN 64-44]|nr:MAG: hypothetical protein ABS76_33690 [Pelagibacterium sp. SCN 64-44]